MQININKIKGYIRANGMTQEEVAKAIGIDNSTLSRKLRSNGTTFTIDQVHKLIDVLDIQPVDAANIFLPKNSQKREQSFQD